MIYNPPPTDAVLLNPDGTVNGPVNPDICASQADCSALVENLRGARVIPPGGNVLIQDEPWTEAGTAVRYGKDGRRIFGLHFTAATGVAYWENVELLYIWLKRAPYPGAQWKLTPIDLIRVGNVVGEPTLPRTSVTIPHIAPYAPDIVLRRRSVEASRGENGLISPHWPLLAAPRES